MSSEYSPIYRFPPLSSELSADLNRFKMDSSPPAVCEQINPTSIKLVQESFYEPQQIHLWHAPPKVSQWQRATWKRSPRECQQHMDDTFFQFLINSFQIFTGTFNTYLIININHSGLHFTATFYQKYLMWDKRQNWKNIWKEKVERKILLTLFIGHGYHLWKSSRMRENSWIYQSWSIVFIMIYPLFILAHVKCLTGDVWRDVSHGRITLNKSWKAKENLRSNRYTWEKQHIICV